MRLKGEEEEEEKGERMTGEKDRERKGKKRK